MDRGIFRDEAVAHHAGSQTDSEVLLMLPGWTRWTYYVLLMAFAGWFVQRLPTGFIPSLDRAILIISLQLPPGAALARTDAVVRQATELMLSTPGVKYSNAFTGRNGATFTPATNAAVRGEPIRGEPIVAQPARPVEAAVSSEAVTRTAGVASAEPVPPPDLNGEATVDVAVR